MLLEGSGKVHTLCAALPSHVTATDLCPGHPAWWYPPGEGEERDQVVGR